MNEKILKNIFDNLELSLVNEMKIKIQHNLEDGKYREYLVKRILSKIVPAKYEITNGFVIALIKNIWYHNNEHDKCISVFLFNLTYFVL